MPEIYGRKYFPCFISFIPSHIKSKTLPRNSFVNLRDTMEVYRILIKRDRVGELTIGLRNKKVVYRGRLFNPYSVCAERKDKAKDQVLDATTNATGVNNGRAEALLYGANNTAYCSKQRPEEPWDQLQHRRYSIHLFRVCFWIILRYK